MTESRVRRSGISAIELPVEHQPEVVQLQCCWNGIVVVAAAPFYAGLAFRSNLPGECGASECSHFCRDMAGLNFSRVAMHHGVRVAYDNATWHRAKALDVPYEAVQLPLAFDRVPSPRTLCCGVHHIVRQPYYARDANESDAAFAYRVWMAVTEEPVADGFADFLAKMVAGKAEVRPAELATFLTDEPRAACRMVEPAATRAPAPCLAPAGRLIPRRLTQVGAADARDALTSHTWTWRRLHPDHEYEFVDAFADGTLPADVAAFVASLGATPYTALAADLARHSLLYERGGIVADLNSVATRSLSCALRGADDFVAAHGDDGRVFALAAAPRHAAVRQRLEDLLQRARRAVVGGAGTDAGASASASAASLPSPREVHGGVSRVDASVWAPGTGPRVRHRVHGVVME